MAESINSIFFQRTKTGQSSLNDLTKISKDEINPILEALNTKQENGISIFYEENNYSKETKGENSQSIKKTNKNGKKNSKKIKTSPGIFENGLSNQELVDSFTKLAKKVDYNRKTE